jgi:hypothetical protein
LGDRLPLYYALLFLLLGLFVAQTASARNRGVEILAFGFLPILGMLTLSRYYYSGLAIFLLSKRFGRASFVVLVGLNLCFYIGSFFVFTNWETYYYPYWGIQVAYLLFFVVGLSWWALRRDPRPQ